MSFDKWFNQQSLLIKVLLLIIPFVGWIVELLVRLSVLLRTKSGIHLVVFILFVVIGWGWFLAVADLIYMLVTGHLFLAE
ncbi:MAG: hypothetical protein ACI35S_10240 [Anaeroplasma sp.]